MKNTCLNCKYKRVSKREGKKIHCMVKRSHIGRALRKSECGFWEEYYYIDSSYEICKEYFLKELSMNLEEISKLQEKVKFLNIR